MSSNTGSKIWNEPLWREAQGKDGMSEIRAHAWDLFTKGGFPDSKNESWKYTRVGTIAEGIFQFAADAKPTAAVLTHIQKKIKEMPAFARIVFLNGRFIPQLSDLKSFADKIDFCSVKELAAQRPDVLSFDPESRGAFDSMNTALFQDGIWLAVREGVRIQEPVMLYYFQAGMSVHDTTQLRHWISLGENSSLKLMEWHDQLETEGGFLNHRMNLRLAAKAELEQVCLQQASLKTWLRASTAVMLAEKSRYQRWDIELGAGVSRNEIDAVFTGANAVCELRGTALGAGDQHFDNQVVMQHAVPEATSHQQYRNLLSGQARGVFGGRVKVFKNAQKTDAAQVHKTLLLSQKAKADVKPQLEIDADDVKCSHGAAIGQLDADSLFYLRSRGISQVHAEKILATGFIEKIFDSLTDPSMKELTLRQVRQKLEELFK